MSGERAYTNAYTDYYAVLGIDRHASDHEIKSAFRHQALLYHPDVNPGGDAVRRFQGIKEAYEVLGNPARRRRYDDECAEYTLSRARPYARGRRSRRRASPLTSGGSGALSLAWRDFWREERRVLALAARGTWAVLRRAAIVVAVVLVAVLVGAAARQVVNRGIAPSGAAPTAQRPAPPNARLNARVGNHVAPRPRFLYGVCVSHCPATPAAHPTRTGTPATSATSGAPASGASEKPLTLYGVCVRHCARPAGIK